MKKRIILLGPALLLSMTVLGAAYGKTAADASQGDDSQATVQTAGDNTSFVEFVTTLLRQDPGNDALREKIIHEALSLPVTLRVPPKALKLMDKAGDTMQEAKTHEEFKEAVSLYQEALSLAPWSAVIYYNLGVAQAKAGRPGNAAKSLHFYLLANPHAEDEAQVLTMIKMLESERTARPVVNRNQDQELEENVRNLRSNPDNVYLKETIIKEVQGMSPPPTIPPGVEERMSEAASDIERISFSSFQSAIQTYREAILMAPWVPELYENLALIEKKASEVDPDLKKFGGVNYHPSDHEHASLLEDAIRNMRLYLLAVPPQGADRQEAQNQLGVWSAMRAFERTELVFSYAPSATNFNNTGDLITAQGNIATTLTTNVSVAYQDMPMTQVFNLSPFQFEELGLGVEDHGFFLKFEYWHAQMPAVVNISEGSDSGKQVGTFNMYNIPAFSFNPLNAQVSLDSFELTGGFDLPLAGPDQGLGPVQLHLPLEIGYGILFGSALGNFAQTFQDYSPQPPVMGGGQYMFNVTASLGLGARIYFLDPFALDIVERYKYDLFLSSNYTSETVGNNPTGTVGFGSPTDAFSGFPMQGFQTQVSLDLLL